MALNTDQELWRRIERATEPDAFLILTRSGPATLARNVQLRIACMDNGPHGALAARIAVAASRRGSAMSPCLLSQVDSLAQSFRPRKRRLAIWFLAARNAR